MCELHETAQDMRTSEGFKVGDDVLVDTMLGKIVEINGDACKVEVMGTAIWYDENSVVFVGRD